MNLTPELLLSAYQQGVFPMADPREENRIYWYAPDPRAVLPLEAFHIPKNVRKLVRQNRFVVTHNQEFEGVLRACAAPRVTDAQTWISEEIIKAYTDLHRLGFAHSIECWQDEKLVGGLYGVALGGAFFGESMFYRASGASKVALVHLVHHLRQRGYTLLDVQFTTDHLKQFGVVEISRVDYERRLTEALSGSVRWG